ncbi:MAG: polymerase sigma factor, sigma-70 family [Planctomycetota bacterium]|nr:polymerase sigma factor, sigma-70 family [Planctomycetota bacterium]
MATRTDRTLRRQLHSLFNLGVIQGLTDGQLLERFATDSGEAAELAFAALVERHGAMVLRVCRGQLRDTHDAQDAYQATFLILIKRARSLWVHDSLGPWLHQVAFRTATCARSSIARRRRLDGRSARCDHYEARSDCEWEHVLHEEINRLPERYRVPIVLCDLEGHSCEEAARKMGRPVGTVKSLRSRGRDRLRNRLIRLGLAPSAALAAVTPAIAAQAGLQSPAVPRAVGTLMDQLIAGTVSASVHSLVNGVLKIMLLSKLRMAAVSILGLLALAAGIGAVSRAWAQDAKPKEPAIPAAQIAEKKSALPSAIADQGDVWPLGLPEAIRVSLTNSGTVRVVKSAVGEEFTVAPQDVKASKYKFTSEIMAHVRSIEQQYWALGLSLVEFGAAETAVDLTAQIVKREEAKLLAGHGSKLNLQEAEEQLKRFKFNMVDKTSQLITTERQLRHILGLPVADGRRIVPSTRPLEAEFKPDWDESIEVMRKNQPDIVSSVSILNAIDPTKFAPAQIQRQKDFNQQVVHQSTHGLARFFLEVDSNYQQFKTAGRLKAAAQQRLDAHAALFENGTITIDRYLDAVNRWSVSVAQEADYRARYNTAIAAFEEVKGTLLAHEHILVAEPSKTEQVKDSRDESVQPASLEPRPQAKPTMPPALDAPKADPAGKTYSFQLRFGVGPKPLEIRGSFTVAPTRAPDTSIAR